MSDDSPYADKKLDQWKGITQKLINEHPIDRDELAKVILDSWDAILATNLGKYTIGVNIFPTQQMLGFFIQQLVSLHFQEKYPDIWRGEEKAVDKDMVNLTNEDFSIEIKTSSHKTGIFGNRSHATKKKDNPKPKKKKSGYYLTINNEAIKKNTKPKILKIRFGWLDHDDWKGQAARTGQAASLSADVLSHKLISLYDYETLNCNS
ncbi:ScaI family restriction endonuclease [Nitrosopumilus sp.]|nr:ScaI family restriction endonuclease [Nitrosopumilus sp.]